jgi:hypothetical protein
MNKIGGYIKMIKIELTTQNKEVMLNPNEDKNKIMELMQWLRDLKENSWQEYIATNKNKSWDTCKSAMNDLAELRQRFHDVWLEVIRNNPLETKYI